MLEIVGLSKRYGEVAALDGATFLGAVLKTSGLVSIRDSWRGE